MGRDRGEPEEAYRRMGPRQFHNPGREAGAMTTKPRRIAAVEARPGYRLNVIWQDGGKAVVDMTGVIHKQEYFAPLRDPTVFQQVGIIDYGTGIEWANGIDYSADSLEMMAKEQSAMTAEEFHAWEREMTVSINEMADIFGFSASTVKAYLTGGSPIPVA